MKIKVLLLSFLVSFLSVNAQNSENPWLIGFGTHGPHMAIGDQFFFKEYINAKNWNFTPAAGQVKVFRHLTKGLSVGTTLSLGSASRTYATKNDRDFFLDWDVTAKYSFANGYILKENCWFDPYFFVGGGLSHWNSLRGDIEGGAGVNLWFVKSFGMFIQSSYNYIPGKKITPVDNNARPSYLHHSIGFVARFGSGKDTDKDGVADKFDKCVDVPGLKTLNGCPDTDGDGIADSEDKCPTVKGLVEFAGCPDTDGDGVVDANDNCPEVKGLVELSGCPDADGDGIADKDDQCPNEKGIASLNGCPDTDGDGIADKNDDCPNVKGLAAFKGCPDTDGDGIADKNDKCPTVFGVASNNGCPEEKMKEEVKQEIQQKLSFAAKNIEFETGSDVIRTKSYTDLDNIVGIMNQYPQVSVNIDGHTDNVGNEAKNVDLSMRRATSVANYLAKKGISMGRMKASGFGPSRPVATNSTADGRQRNRRVELNIAQ